MQYGYFDDAAREYVITEPQTPSPWINYLGSEAFFTLMSNTSGGYSFYKDARMLRLTRYRYNNVPTDAGGQYFYINDGGVVWTPGFMPVKTPLDRYECRHGLGYTRITGEKNDLEAVETAMVPRGVNALVTKVELTNRSDAAKEVSLFSFVEFCLWNAQDDATNFQRNFSHRRGRDRGQRDLSQDRIPRAPQPFCRVRGQRAGGRLRHRPRALPRRVQRLWRAAAPCLKTGAATASPAAGRLSAATICASR